uniref:Uncharacterized protein n=1 Tax=Cacopsylla melanoneura TaxID=428564 RepID=A0A8D8XC84_9HEMI
MPMVMRCLNNESDIPKHGIWTDHTKSRKKDLKKGNLNRDKRKNTCYIIMKDKNTDFYNKTNSIFVMQDIILQPVIDVEVRKLCVPQEPTLISGCMEELLKENFATLNKP